MTIGQIKIEALKLMFANYAEDISSADEDIDVLMSNESYASYLQNMNGSIHRAVQEMYTKNKVPTSAYYLNGVYGTTDDYGFERFNLESLISDFGKFVRLDKEYYGEYFVNYPHRMESNILLLPSHRQGNYIVRYYPRLDYIERGADNDTELNIPEYLASIIPYFIKGDLYQDDEPNLASEARNWFEQMLAEYNCDDGASRTSVDDIYRMW